MSGNKKRTVFFDLETGGLTPGVHPIIQFAGVAVDEEFKILEEFEIKLNFDVAKCSKEALEINSFNPELWDEVAMDPRAAQLQISAFLKRHATLRLVSKKGRPYTVAALAGHNAATFDGPFLQAWYKSLGAFLPASYQVLCTLQLAAWRFYDTDRKPDNLKLGTLCRWFKIALPDAHDALSDVRANVELARILQIVNLEQLRKSFMYYSKEVVLSEMEEVYPNE